MTVAPVADPVIVQVTQPFGWVPTVLSFIQFVGLAVLSIYTFNTSRSDKTTEMNKAAADKRRDRRANWFQKIVVDEALKSVPNFSNAQTQALQAASLEFMRLRALSQPPSQNPEDLIRDATNGFQVALSQVTCPLFARIGVFDKELVKSLSVISDRFEASVTEWMAGLTTRKPYESCESLPDLILRGEAQILKVLYDFEFGPKLSLSSEGGE